jgi:6,7-dimethyl-8-ribityllumazine synthase
LAHACASSGRYDGVIALGCLIRGETRHDRYIAEAVAHGLIGVTVQTGVPVAFGVLTVDHAKQAKARAGGTKGNKGGEAAAALLETILVKRSIAMGKTMSVGEELESKPDKARKKPRKKAATRRRA